LLEYYQAIQINEIVINATIWKKFENIMWSHEGLYSVLFYLYEIPIGKSIGIENRLLMAGAQGTEVVRSLERKAKGTRIYTWVMKCSQIACGNWFATLWIY
jgi:hypothetical protein